MQAGLRALRALRYGVMTRASGIGGLPVVKLKLQSQGLTEGRFDWLHFGIRGVNIFRPA
jgi:hypothetical protein